MVGTPGGMVNTNHLLLLKDGVGLLTAGGGPLGGVGYRRAGDVAGAHRLTLSSCLLSLGRSSLGGCERSCVHQTSSKGVEDEQG